MLSTDEIILDILTTEKTGGNELISKFHIGYPSKQVAEESNSIFVACVSSESNLDGFDFSTFKDLVEILIVTKIKDYSKAKTVIKTVSREICRVIMENHALFPNKPVIRNINPEYNKDFVLTRGHIMVQVNTEPVDYLVDEGTFNSVCDIIIEDIEVD